MVLPIVLLAMSLMLVPGLVLAQDDASVGYDLWMRARAPGIVTDPYRGPTSSAEALGLETMRAPTGAGTTRMPRLATGREPGVYVGVVVCDPDGVERVYRFRADDGGTLPEGPRRGVGEPRRPILPGRP